MQEVATGAAMVVAGLPHSVGGVTVNRACASGLTAVQMAADRIRVGEADVARLESWCDRLNGDLPPLEEFVIPGGGPVGAFLHQARTVCRRSERRLVALMEIESEVGDGCLVYLNRLSDLLFVLARALNRANLDGLGGDDVYWRSERLQCEAG